uniref:NAC domain-containing protein n=1 Tax=Oryza punctata TaxID=4537 RepID=A0A0E0MD44_ORYPU
MASASRKRSARSRQEDEQSSSAAAAAAVAEEEEGVAVAGMEAWRFGFSKFSEFPAFKFDPTDADIVASYLLPRALYGRGHAAATAVIEDDVSRCEPWTLMRVHGHAASAHAFFVHDHPDSGGGRRRKVQRAVKNGGGVWRIQKGEVATLTIVRDGDGVGGDLDVVYKRRNLSFHRHGESSTSGWVMHEYEITSPPLNATVLSRIRATSRAKDKKLGIKEEPSTSAAGDGERTVPNPDHNAGGDSNHGYYSGDNNYDNGGVVQYYPDQPGPSHQCCYGEQVAGNGFVTGDDGGEPLHLYETFQSPKKMIRTYLIN